MMGSVTCGKSRALLAYSLARRNVKTSLSPLKVECVVSAARL
jgi:hypothetical protein